MKINEDGSVNLMIGAVEMGTGAATTAMAQICAEELGVGLDDVEVWNTDSELISADFGTYGSRVMTIGGSAEYKRKMVRVFVRRALRQALAMPPAG